MAGMQRHTITAVLGTLGLALAGGAYAGLLDDPAPTTATTLAAQDDDGKKDDAKDDGAEAEKKGPVVSGKVSFEGDIPEPKELKVPAQAAEGCCPPGTKVDRTDKSLLIDEDRGIANVVVTVKVEGTEVKVRKEPYTVDQKGCRFLPHLQVVPKGATVEFLNSDETSHNVRLVTLLNDPLNQTVLAGKKLTQKFEEPERIKVECDMHTWMRSWVVVTDATHWTVTDAKGAFELEGLPPGEHEVSLWHESLGTKTVKVVVGEDGKAEPIEVAMEKKKRKSPRRRR